MPRRYIARTVEALLALAVIAFIVHEWFFESVLPPYWYWQEAAYCAITVTAAALAFYRMRRAGRPWNWIAGSVGIVASLATALMTLVVWDEYGQDITAVLAASPPARWMRCRNVDRPILADTPVWRLTYGWGGGYGGDEYAFELDSSGGARVTQRAYNVQKPTTSAYQFTTAQVREIAAAVDDLGLLCQSTERRPGSIDDMATVMLTVSAGGARMQIMIDPEHTIPDERALHALEELVERVRREPHP